MLTLVTLTRHERPELLDRCCSSVAKSLISGSRHEIITCHGDFTQARYDATQLSEYVAFVDDDDSISPDTISVCMAAIAMHPSAGLLFTNEVVVDVNGNELSANRNLRTYTDIKTHPRAAHHLAIIKRSSITHKALEVSTELGIGVDWVLKASAAFTSGAIHVPIDGYFWTHHESQHSTRNKPAYDDCMPAVRNAIAQNWKGYIGRVPVYSPVN